MAVVKISDETVTTTPLPADLVELELTAAPASRKCTLEDLFNSIISTATKKGTALQAAAVADIPSPGAATTTDCANKINALLASLRTAGLLHT